MVDALLLVGIVIAAFVAYNIGGATAGPAFGPAVGAGVLRSLPFEPTPSFHLEIDRQRGDERSIDFQTRRCTTTE